jgi:hypothetical protein
MNNEILNDIGNRLITIAENANASMATYRLAFYDTVKSRKQNYVSPDYLFSKIDLALIKLTKINVDFMQLKSQEVSNSISNSEYDLLKARLDRHKTALGELSKNKDTEIGIISDSVEFTNSIINGYPNRRTDSPLVAEDEMAVRTVTEPPVINATMDANAVQNIRRAFVWGNNPMTHRQALILSAGYFRRLQEADNELNIYLLKKDFDKEHLSVTNEKANIAVEKTDLEEQITFIESKKQLTDEFKKSFTNISIDKDSLSEEFKFYIAALWNYYSQLKQYFSELFYITLTSQEQLVKEIKASNEALDEDKKDINIGGSITRKWLSTIRIQIEQASNFYQDMQQSSNLCRCIIKLKDKELENDGSLIVSLSTIKSIKALIDKSTYISVEEIFAVSDTSDDRLLEVEYSASPYKTVLNLCINQRNQHRSNYVGSSNIISGMPPGYLNIKDVVKNALDNSNLEIEVLFKCYMFQ